MTLGRDSMVLLASSSFNTFDGRLTMHAAHSLAKWAVNQLCDCMWVGECPPQLFDVILAEQAY
jgi:hypothetical protein